MLAFVLWGSFLGLAGSSAVRRPLYGEITSPKYPNPYPNHNVSTWDIAVPSGYSVKLTFWYFDLEPSESCIYDYVKVSADKRDLGRFCGQVGSSVGNHPGQRSFVSKGTRMRLIFKSDFSNEENGTTIFYKGFLAYYQAIDLNECTQNMDSDDPEEPLCDHLCHNYVGGYFCSCRPGFQLQRDRKTCKVDCSGEMYTEVEGYISSPEYPQPYPPDLQCNYSIRLEKGLAVTLKFLDIFEIDDHQQVKCPYDLLKIQAGERQIEAYCGRQSPGIINTNTHAVDLLFTTDDSGDSRGWKVHYTSERVSCPEPKPLDEFSIIKPPSVTDYRYQDYFIVYCETGYKLMEDNTELRSFTAVCQNDGTWHRPIPRCEIVSCPSPKNMANGVFEYRTTEGVNTYQSVIEYKCKEPYYTMVIPSGNGTYTCTEERFWKDNQGSKDIPQCHPVCGKPDNPVFSVQKIIGGDKAKAGNFPWQVYLRETLPGGGALISDRWILTAAHVVIQTDNVQVNEPDVEVLMGDIDVNEQRNLGNYKVESIVPHPNYTRADHNFNNDIALIKLKDSVTMNANIMPICLPWRNNETFYQAGRMGYVSGFGVNEHNMIDTQLRYVHLPIVTSDTCSEYLINKIINGKPHVFSKNMFCAGYPKGLKQNKDSCQGDSGGAYAIEEPDTHRWIVTGIVSWGIGCGRGYGFYTKVSNYRDWIEEVMKGPPALSPP